MAKKNRRDAAKKAADEKKLQLALEAEFGASLSVRNSRSGGRIGTLGSNGNKSGSDRELATLKKALEKSMDKINALKEEVEDKNTR